MATVAKKLFTEEEFLAIEAKSQTKHEFYRGEIFAMAGGSAAHSRIATNCVGELYVQLRGRPCRANNSDVMVKVKTTSLMTYPDVSVACPPFEAEPAPIEVLLNPKVLIEVLSPSTELYDRNTKFRHFQQIPSVAEIVLIRQDEAVVEHYQRQADSAWLMTTLSGLDATLQLSSIACQLPLAHIYDRVEFPPPTPPSPPQVG